MVVAWGRMSARRSSGASFYSATRLVPQWWIRTTANRRSVVARATWRRRALADGLEDRLGLYKGAAGALLRLGRRRPWQEPTVAGR